MSYQTLQPVAVILLTNELRNIIKTGNISLDCDLELLDFLIESQYCFEDGRGGFKLTKKGWGFLKEVRKAG